MKNLKNKLLDKIEKLESNDDKYIIINYKLGK